MDCPVLSVVSHTSPACDITARERVVLAGYSSRVGPLIAGRPLLFLVATCVSYCCGTVVPVPSLDGVWVSLLRGWRRHEFTLQSLPPACGRYRRELPSLQRPGCILDAVSFWTRPL